MATDLLPSSPLPAPRTGVTSGGWRDITWALKEFLLILGVFSLVTGDWKQWIDLRFNLGILTGVVAYALPVLWVVSLLVLNFVVGPRIVVGGGGRMPATGKARPMRSWHWAGGTVAVRTLHLLLIPTYLLIACLSANLLYYVHIVRTGHLDCAYPLPSCALLLPLLGLWQYGLHRQRQAAPRRREPVARRTAVLAVAWLGMCLAGLGWCFFLLGYAQPPRTAVDVAVVLGHRILPDGTASDTLRARTQAATDLYHQHLARHILVSGEIEVINGHRRSEAWAMRQVCRDAGVPDQDIFMDPFGDNTRATVYHTRLLMQQQGWHTVAAVSNDMHLLRLAHEFAAAGLTAATVPAKLTVWIPAHPWDVARETLGNIVYWFNPHYHQAKDLLMTVADPRIVVHKSRRQLELYDGATLVKTYVCFTGTYPGTKVREGDRRTPEGTFRIVFKNPESKYHLSLGLDYPRVADAQRGLAAGLLSPAQYQTLLHALEHGDMTDEATQNVVWKTPLGGEIFIHGGAEQRVADSGSAGCVVVSNADIEELYAVCRLGTLVRIES